MDKNGNELSNTARNDLIAVIVFAILVLLTYILNFGMRFDIPMLSRKAEVWGGLVILLVGYLTHWSPLEPFGPLGSDHSNQLIYNLKVLIRGE